MSGDRKPALVVSIHDVSPAFLPQLKLILSKLKEIEVPFLVLKVIPNFQGKNKINLFPSFIDWLKDLSLSGCEIVLHGLVHLRPSQPNKLWVNPRKWLTQGEDEFAHLKEAEARQRINEGLRIFKEAGLTCFGFTAPTWRLNRWTIKVLAEANFHYFTTLTEVVDLRKNRRFFSPALGHQGITGWLESLMGVGNELSRLFLLPWLNLIRIVFHPRGLEHPNFKKSIKLVKQLLPLTQPLTYSRFLTQ